MNFQSSKVFSPYVVSVVVSVLVLFISFTETAKNMEEVSLDYRFQRFPRPELADSNVIIIAIDNASLDYFAEVGLNWPWSRDIYGYLLDVLSQHQVSSVLFDVLFFDADMERFEVDPLYTDATFARRLREHTNVVLAAELLPEGDYNKEAENNLTLSSVDFTKLMSFEAVRRPFYVFAEAASHIGASNVLPDRGGLIRQTYLGFDLQGEFVPSLSVRSLLASGIQFDISEGALSVNGHIYSLENYGRKRIYWYGKAGPNGAFRYLPFAALITDPELSQVSDLRLQNKHVIIGAYASGLLDYKPTPVSNMHPFPGMEIWATVTSNLLNNHFVRELNIAVQWILLFALSLFSVFLFKKMSVYRAIIAISMVMIGYLLFGVYIWHYVMIALPVVSGILSVVFSTLVISALLYLQEGRSKRELRTVFNRYVHPDVIEALVDRPEEIRMGGDMVNATILFTDIANFTTYSENKSPTELVSELNKYLSVLTETILDEGGLLDKFTGDGIMALFGVPIPNGNHAIQACRAALQHKQFTEMLSEKGNSDGILFFHVNTRIGINSGDIIAGNIGSHRRMDYTAIGDDVNLAARLEGVNKEYGTRIIIGENTWNLVKEHFLCRELDAITVKGKAVPLRIFELISETPPNKIIPSWITEYHEALALYKSGKFSEALVKFKSLNGDEPSAKMTLRCENLIVNPPTDWDGIYKMTSK